MLLFNRRLCLCGVSALVAGGIILLSVNVRAAEEPKPNVGRIAAIKHIMSGIHAPNAGAIGELLKAEGPKDEAGWAKLALHAALLNESGHLLMQNNRCPDGVWSDATAKLREGTTAVYVAAGKKDLKAAQDGFKEVGAACAACHAKHKLAAAPAPAAAAPAPAPAPAPAAAAAPAPAPAAAPAAPAAQEARLAAVRHIMAGINGPTCGALGEALKGDPKDDKAWADIVRHAALLNEVGFLLMENKRCPDQVWKDACTALRDNAGKVALAGGSKNLEDARTGFKGVTGACGSCHTVHKKPPA